MPARTLLRFALLGALVTTPALAAEVTVGQKGQKFSEESVTLKAGDSIKFQNDDNISHNVLSKGPGGNKNAGLQKAGDASTILYDKPGEYEVVCGIHPKMKLHVKVD
ncbi:MAG: cupredoxin domain-containing protein [Alphaproteobacteria bacterium]|nr:cupredoxin domain-containing protein [Alphaproteobacteria bacterium]